MNAEPPPPDPSEFTPAPTPAGATPTPTGLPAPAAPAPRPPKSPTRLFLEDLAVSGCGLATSTAVAYGSYYLRDSHDFAVYTWMANYVLPIGAILCGVLAAIGYLLGARWFNHRPSRLLLVNIVLVSFTTYFSIHYLNFSHAHTPGGLPLESVMTFPDYLVAITEHMVYKSDRSYEQPFELGRWGWGVAALQIAGFCLGGFLVYGVLAAVPYCDRCSRYFRRQWHLASKWKDIPVMGQAYETMAGLFAANQLQAGVDLFTQFAGQRGFRRTGSLVLALHKCPGCERRRLKLTAQQQRGNRVTVLKSVLIPTEQPIRKPTPAGASAA